MTTPPSQAGSGRDRLQRALMRLPQASPRSTRRVRKQAAVHDVASASGHASPDDEGRGRVLPDELVELLDRLDNIADRLADQEHPGRPLPATRAIFAEWVRLRKV